MVSKTMGKKAALTNPLDTIVSHFRGKKLCDVGYGGYMSDKAELNELIHLTNINDPSSILDDMQNLINSYVYNQNKDLQASIEPCYETCSHCNGRGFDSNGEKCAFCFDGHTDRISNVITIEGYTEVFFHLVSMLFNFKNIEVKRIINRIKIIILTKGDYSKQNINAYNELAFILIDRRNNKNKLK